MMLMRPVQPTDYDWNFHIGRIPVCVSVWFWAGCAVLGINSLKMGVEFLIAWAVVLLASILVHELGHAWTAQAYGYRPRILLYHFGGLAMYDAWGQHSRMKSIIISFAGPFAGFCLWGLVKLFIAFGLPHMVFGERSGPLMSFTLFNLLRINLYWGLVNLLPVLPLDGGRIAQQVFGWSSPRQGDRYTVMLGAFVGGAVAVIFFSQGETYAALLFAMLCAQNLSALQNPYL